MATETYHEHQGFSDKRCGTEDNIRVKCAIFHNIKGDQDFKSWFGISRAFYEALLELVEVKEVRAVSKQDKLLLVFMKMRVNLSYIQMAPLFGIDRQTVSKYFKEG